LNQEKRCQTTNSLINTSTNKCEAPTQYIDAERVCPIGFNDNSDFESCVVEVIKPAIPMCNTGFIYHEEQNLCVDENSQDPSITCLDGYTLTSDNKYCEKVISVIAGTQCEPGFNAVSASICRADSLSDTAAKCPIDYILDPIKNICEKHEITPVVYTCESDYVYDDAQKSCQITTIQNGIEWCPNGYILTADKAQCFKTETKAATQECPEGYLNQNDGTCSEEIIVAPTVTCPINYGVNDFGKCVRLDSHDALISCGEGYEYNGTHCLKIDSKPIKNCAAGFIMVGGGCYLHDYADYECPKGYSLIKQDGELVCKWKNLALSTVNCLIGSYSASMNSCINPDNNFDYGIQNVYCEPRKDKTGKSIAGVYISNIKRCDYTSIYNAQEYRVDCPGDFIELGERYCRSILADNSKVICPSSYNYNNQTAYCEKELLEVASLFCYDGFELRNDKCTKEIVVDVTSSECPVGFTQTSNTQCSRSESIDATLFCPIGFIQTSDLQCTRRTYLPPMIN
jgi:hypothetical protein